MSATAGKVGGIAVHRGDQAMSYKRARGLVLVLACLLPLAANASQCVECHTDAEKLQAITAKLPVPVVSAETAGKG